MVPHSCRPALHTPPPSMGDKENRDVIRAVVAVASATLAAPGDTGNQFKPVAPDAHHTVASPEN